MFNDYDEAKKHSLTVPWKLETCNVGEDCWCRIIVPVEPIKYINKIGDTERIDEIDYIIPDGSIDKETAEYFLELHNRSVELYRNQKSRLESLNKLSKLDQELGFQ
jgi:hypothetical protein